MAKDKLLDWLEDAGCNHYQCTYGVDIECDDCIKRMVAEHDAEIRRKTIVEFVSRAEEKRDNVFNYYDDDYKLGLKHGYMISIDIAEKMKGETE